MKNRVPYSVPEGYFASLEERLHKIPELGRGKYRSPFWYYSLSAACAVAVAILMVFVWKGDRDRPETVEYEQYLMSELVPHTDPYLIYTAAEDNTNTMTAQDIEEYLITCAVNINEE